MWESTLSNFFRISFLLQSHKATIKAHQEVLNNCLRKFTNTDQSIITGLLLGQCLTKCRMMKECLFIHHWELISRYLLCESLYKKRIHLFD